MLDLVDQYRRKQLHHRIYEKRVAAIDERELELRRENALREEIERNMKDFVATSLQSHYRGWEGRCIAAIAKRRHLAAIEIQRIARGLLARRLAARERRKLRQVLYTPVALKLLLERSTLVRTVKNWQELLDSHTGEHFYFHVFTHDSQWLPPEPYVEFLRCEWPECAYVAKTVHEIHEHYRTLHIWYCPVCVAKVSTWTFPQCPICKSVCSHDPETGEILGPGETQLHAIKQAKDAEDGMKRQKEEMQQHRMQAWAELVAQEDKSRARSRRKKSRLAFGGGKMPHASDLSNSASSASFSGTGPLEDVSEEDAEILKLAQIDPSIMGVKWITSVQRRAKDLRVFAKSFLPFGSLYVGDFHPKDRRFGGFGEILYANGGKYTGQWKDNLRSGKGIYQSSSGNEYVGEWLDGRKHGLGIHTLSTGERYIGQFVEGKYQGLGVLFAVNGDKYEGEFSANAPNGHGKFKTVNGDRFVGTTVSGQAQGIGIITKADGEVYKGEWTNDFRHGRGVCFYPNGAVYSGEWWHGRWSGSGVYISSEGIRFIGEFVNGEKHGKGKLIFENGDMFDGFFVHDMAQGEGPTKGIYRFKDSGNIYIGGWNNNKREGKGAYMFRDGSVFSGHFYNDHAQGRGKMVYANGNVYKGEFLRAEKHGAGVYNWANGSVYEGHFEHGLIHGFGEMVYASGHRYEGHWEKNKKHGVGTFHYPNGDIYEGDWVADHRHGQGKFVWNPETPLQESYKGCWDVDRRHGRGKYCYSDGTSYEGDWVYGKRQGNALFKWPNGDFYDGQFENEMQHGVGSFYSASSGDLYEGKWVGNVREGHGKIVYASGKVFEGTFHEGRRHGDGIMTYLDGNRFKGTWNRDKKQGGGSYLLNVGGGDSEQTAGEALSIRVFGY
ncbi:Radial spoke head protein [Globisporangium polare]